MARVQTIIVGGGIGAGSPFTLNFVPYIASVDPPLLAATDFVFVVPTGASRGLVVGASDPGAGPERLRVNGGAIIRGDHATSTSIGDNSPTGGINQILIGDGITAGTQAGIVIGQSAVNGTGGGANVVIGNGSTLAGAGLVIRGTSAVAGAGNHTVINGTSTGGTNASHLNIGAACNITTGVTALGHGTTVGSSATNGTTVGANNTLNSGTNGVLLGAGCSINNTAFENCIAIGAASCWQTRMISIGSNVSLSPPTMMALGHGLDTIANPTAFLIRLTNSSGSNNTAGALTLQAGLSTGNIVGNGVNLDAGIPGASGTTLQTARTWVSARPTTTAADTGLMVYDVDNATLERVTVGAADSGGVGFKLLRIPN